MTNRPTRIRRDTRRRDALIALPLGQFRRRLPRLSLDELNALQARIGVLTISARWARGGSHGIARHRSRNELGRLARRAAAVGEELAARRPGTPPLHLLDPAPVPLLADADQEEYAA